MSRGVSTSTIHVDVVVHVAGQGVSRLPNGSVASQRVDRVSPELVPIVSKLVNPLTMEVHAVIEATADHVTVLVQGQPTRIAAVDVIEGFWAVWGPA